MICQRLFSSSTLKGTVIGIHRNPATKSFELQSPVLASSLIASQILDHLQATGVKGKVGECRLISNPSVGSIAVVSLGDESASASVMPFSRKEKIRRSVSAGVRALQLQGIAEISVDSFSDPEAAAEGALISTYSSRRFKSSPIEEPLPLISFANLEKSEAFQSQWERGKLLAECQNFARELADTPANYLTPKIFCTTARDCLEGVPGITLHERDADWLQRERMLATLGVAKGSVEPARLLEIHYGPPACTNERPVVLIGKGVTFDAYFNVSKLTQL